MTSPGHQRARDVRGRGWLRAPPVTQRSRLQAGGGPAAGDARHRPRAARTGGEGSAAASGGHRGGARRDGRSGAQGAIGERRPSAHGGSGAGAVPRRAATTAPPSAPDPLAAAQGRPPVAAGRGAETSSSSGWPRERCVYGWAEGRSQCRRAGAGAIASTALPSAGTHGPGASTRAGTVPPGGRGGLRRPRSAPVPHPERVGRWKCPGVPGDGEGPR
ncbi:PE-PGRS family protein PE_PGRS61-like [Corvus cornix cornix]|uniref:PE-PGRS family protein PE_PGRS61-like n=1 Tax=Corvus cornix cornix TaxID=932674 RepID=UPI001951FB00|nr:PE-PGRS family protein PE_PGRS61-like [Corvus cornix cornix]